MRKQHLENRSPTANVMFEFLQTEFFGFDVDTIAVIRIAFVVVETFQLTEENMTESVRHTAVCHVHSTSTSREVRGHQADRCTY